MDEWRLSWSFTSISATVNRNTRYRGVIIMVPEVEYLEPGWNGQWR